MSEDLELAKRLDDGARGRPLGTSTIRQASEAITRLVGEVEGLKATEAARCLVSPWAKPTERPLFERPLRGTDTGATPSAGQADKYLALPSRVDEGELQEALERALADCPMAPHMSASLCNMVGRHMSHHLVDVQREFAAAPPTQQGEG